MPNIINADNGVISGVAGIKTSADTSGVLNIQTNGTTAISISTAQVVSLTNSPTFTGGTANGVLYLNGSKVATSGSALTFDGTSLTFGSTAQRITADMSNGTVSNRFAFQTSTTNGNTQVNAIPNGTSTASQFIAYNNSDPNNASSIQLTALSTTTRLLAGQTGTGTYLPITFFTNGSEQARLDTSGNLGLGVTPSAWDSGRRVFQIGGNGALWGQSSGSGFLFLSNNLYYDGTNFRYLNTAASAYYTIASDASHRWHQAVSGTAGNAISFTQAMTLNADRRLQLNTTTFVGNEQFIIGFDSSGTYTQALNTKDTNASANGNSHIVLRRSDDTYLGALGRAGTDTAMFVDGNSYLALRTGGTERARIDSSGNFGIGTSSPAYPLQVRRPGGACSLGLTMDNYGAIAELARSIFYYAIGDSTSDRTGHLFFTRDATATDNLRLVINSAGNVGIGTASPGTKLHVTGSNGLFAQFLNSANNTGEGIVIGSGSSLGRISTNGASTAMAFEINAVERMRLDSSGNLGLGVTPSAWGGGYKAIEILGYLGLGVAGGTTQFFTNSFYNGSNYIYRNTAAASFYAQSAGSHLWSTAPSGTAGNAISFTQAMTLNASGNLGIGSTASPSGRLSVFGSAASSIEITIDTNATSGRIQTYSSSPLHLNPLGNEVLVGGTTDQGAYNLQCNGTGVWGAGAYVNGSDARLKDNIQSLDSGLDVVKAIRPVTFQYKPEYNKDQSVQPGFIAQELQAAMAGKAYLEGVVQSGPEHLNVAYQNIIPILVKAIQELKAELDQLKGVH